MALPQPTPAFPRDLRVGGQLLWDSHRQRVWLFLGVLALRARQHSCMSNGENPRGLLLLYSTDLGRSWSRPLNVSAAIAPQFGSLCVAPSFGNAALDLGQGELLFMANVLGTTAVAPNGGELIIRATEGADGGLHFNVSRDLLRPCVANGTRHCTFNEAAMAFLPPPPKPHRAQSPRHRGIIVIMRSDPPVTHTYATATSTDSGASFSRVRFREKLTSVDCQASAALCGARLFVAAPQLANTGLVSSRRSNMTLVRSVDGETFLFDRVVWRGPSMYSNLQPDPEGGGMYLFFERALRDRG